MENIFYLNGNVENVAFQPSVYLIANGYNACCLAGFTENIAPTVIFLLDLHLYFLHIDQCQNIFQKQKRKICIQNLKPNQNAQSCSVVSVAAV